MMQLAQHVSAHVEWQPLLLQASQLPPPAGTSNQAPVYGCVCACMQRLRSNHVTNTTPQVRANAHAQTHSRRHARTHKHEHIHSHPPTSNSVR